jgi:hypothetical protein
MGKMGVLVGCHMIFCDVKVGIKQFPIRFHKKSINNKNKHMLIFVVYTFLMKSNQRTLDVTFISQNIT